MMIPTELVVITNFRHHHRPESAQHLHRSDPALRNVGVFTSTLLKETFSQVPDELYYAAKVDGTSDLKYLFQ